MATPAQLLKKIAPMSDSDFEGLLARTGLKGYPKEQFARLGIGDPRTEAIICDVLGLPTEQDKAIRASIVNTRLSWVAIFISIVALVVAVISLVKNLT